MTIEFLHRIRKELTITVTGAYETVIVIAERVNRKVERLKLDWKASKIYHDMELIHQEAGQYLTSSATQPDQSLAEVDVDRKEFESRLATAAARIRLLRDELALIERARRELETDALRDTLLAVHHDLFQREGTIERIVVAGGTAALGATVEQLALSPSSHVCALLRGPLLLPNPSTTPLRAGDIVILVGRSDELRHDLAKFTAKQRASA